MTLIKKNWKLREIDIGSNTWYGKRDIKNHLEMFEDFILTYIPYKKKCESCKKDFVIMYVRKKFIKNGYHYCDNCLRLKIFGNFS